MVRIRLDEALVRRGYAPSRSRARDAISRGHVTVDGRPTGKPAARVEEDASITVDDPALEWVSRAALKLIAGLEAFDVDPAGKICLDIGASTGGFTQVLLARGAKRVYAIEVGHGQLDPALVDDPRVVSFEGLNARDLSAEEIPVPVDLIVADVSFVSLKLVLEPALALTGPNAMLVALVKPQFEVGRKLLGRGGIVRDREAARAAANNIADWLTERDWTIAGIIDSPIAGGDGNREFLLGAARIDAGGDSD
jgi:23S rRNA (cytidine1920-2'-O)/16S rRNA (cytidine1409-2'-O)-methyltransferase